MRKTWISILLASVLLLSSCANISTESTVDNSSETTVAIETTSTEIETDSTKITARMDTFTEMLLSDLKSPSIKDQQCKKRKKSREKDG